MADFLTSPQVADLLGVSDSTVLRMVAAGLLTPAGRMPGPKGAYLFNPASIPGADPELAVEG